MKPSYNVNFNVIVVLFVICFSRSAENIDEYGWRAIKILMKRVSNIKKNYDLKIGSTYILMRHHVSNTTVVIGSLTLNSSHQQFIRCKEEIKLTNEKEFSYSHWIVTNYRFTNCCLHKNLEIRVCNCFSYKYKKLSN